MARDLNELYMRRAVCKACIKVIDNIENDPRKQDAMENYKAQLAKIDGEIEEVTGTPPPVMIGLQAAKLTGKVPGLG